MVLTDRPTRREREIYSPPAFVLAMIVAEFRLVILQGHRAWISPAGCVIM